MPIPALKKVQEAVDLLHEKDIVIGDLQDPNILYVASKDSDEGCVMLVNLDWLAKADILPRSTLMMLGLRMFRHMGLCENPMIYGNWIEDIWELE